MLGLGFHSVIHVAMLSGEFTVFSTIFSPYYPISSGLSCWPAAFCAFLPEPSLG